MVLPVIALPGGSLEFGDAGSFEVGVVGHLVDIVGFFMISAPEGEKAEGKSCLLNLTTISFLIRR